MMHKLAMYYALFAILYLVVVNIFHARTRPGWAGVLAFVWIPIQVFVAWTLWGVIP